MLLTIMCQGQRTWYGEISASAGGGANDIFRFDELVGAGSVTGTGMWTSGIDFRRIYRSWFSLETGLGYSHQYYYTSPAPGIPGEDIPDSFGILAVPVTARVDFLRFFFADAGAVISLQAGFSDTDNMTGLGATLGVGLQHNFKSDIFIRIRLYAAQYALLHFLPEDHPQTLWNSGATIGVGYNFIHLGKCNCPDDNSPGRRFY